MSRPRTAAAAATARRAAPRAPRRISGPVRPRAVPGQPRPTTPVTTSTHTLGSRVRALPDARMLDRLLRSRAWIWLLGIALGGIVAMQVSLLGMNAGISKSVQSSTDLEHRNSMLEEQISGLSGGDRVRGAAADLGLVTPDAGAVDFLSVRPGVDASRGANRIVPPSDEARQNLANGGVSTTAVTPVVVPVTTTITDPVTSTETAPTTTETAPVTTETAPVAETTPVPVTPAATAVPETTTTTTAGATVAP